MAGGWGEKKSEAIISAKDPNGTCTSVFFSLKAEIDSVRS